MPNLTRPKIAYLFGAGSTHAEIVNLEESPSDNFRDRNGVLISQVSKRVIENAQNEARFKSNIEPISSKEGANIELLISLIETNRIKNADWKVTYLKNLVEKDITKRLSKTRMNKFYLNKGLLELHDNIDQYEELLGFITLNYDTVLDSTTLSNNTSYVFRPDGECTLRNGDKIDVAITDNTYGAAYGHIQLINLISRKR